MLATPTLHSLYLSRSGDNCIGDIPLEISISAWRTSSGQNPLRRRIATSLLHIRPDAGRLLNPQWVSDDAYVNIQNHAKALTEGQGAERLYALLCAQFAQPDVGKPDLSVCYSMRGVRDTHLIRNYLTREGHVWPSSAAVQQSVRVVDVRHALMIIAGVSRAMETWNVLPKELRDYDLNRRDLDPAKLCRISGVSMPDGCTQSSALLRLAIAAREAAFSVLRRDIGERRRQRRAFLRKLGKILLFLEGFTGVAPEHTGADTDRERLQFLKTKGDEEFSPSMAALLLRRGAWRPVVRAETGATGEVGNSRLYSLLEARPLRTDSGISAPLAPLGLLADDSGWSGNSDTFLRRICGREGEAFDLESLRKAFRKLAGDWPPAKPDSAAPPPLKSNSWLGAQDAVPSAAQRDWARKAAFAINRGDLAGARKAFAEIEQHDRKDGAGAAGAKLLNNLNLTASRADLFGDGRKVWLRQMALLLDSEAWQGEVSFSPDKFLVALFGDGAVARHNRIAIANRSGWGIPASSEALAAVSRAPRAAKTIMK